MHLNDSSQICCFFAFLRCPSCATQQPAPLYLQRRCCYISLSASTIPRAPHEPASATGDSPPRRPGELDWPLSAVFEIQRHRLAANAINPSDRLPAVHRSGASSPPPSIPRPAAVFPVPTLSDRSRRSYTMRAHLPAHTPRTGAPSPPPPEAQVAPRASTTPHAPSNECHRRLVTG